jgi:hypothetical protein
LKVSEFNPTSVAGEASTSTVPYKDRSPGLVIFGILTMLLGCVSGLFAVILVTMVSFTPRRSGMPTASMAPGILMYGSMAVTLIWLGIGSIQAKRWARALLLIFSWSWLIVGVFVTIAMLFFVPHMFANMPSNGPGNQQMPPMAVPAVMLVLFLIFGFFFVLLPAIWTFFYTSKHVKDTCESRDPIERWTDACPLPVLAFCLWLVFGAVMMLIMPFSSNGVMPFFGTFIDGFGGSVFCVAAAAVWGIAALMLYQLDDRGWWVILIALCVMLLSGVLTYSQHSIWEMYHLMGYSARQISDIKHSGVISNSGMNWMMALSTLPFIGFLFYIKKYMQRESG